MPLKVIDMDEYIENPDKEKAPIVEAIDDGMKFEITDTESDKKYTLDADGLKGGDYHQIIQASDGTIPEEDIKRYYEAAMAIKTFYIESDEPRDLGDEIKHDWIQEIWDQVNPGLKLIRHYLNGHHKHQSSGIHMDSWTGNQYTVIVYLTPDWHPDDGGTIEFWTPNLTDKMRALAINTPYGFGGSPDMNIIKSYWPRAGRVIVFDARIPHVERAVETDKFKVSLVFKGTTDE